MWNNKEELADRGQDNGSRVGDDSKALRRGEDEGDVVTRKRNSRKCGGESPVISEGIISEQVRDNTEEDKYGDKQVEIGESRKNIRMGPEVDTKTFEKIIKELSRRANRNDLKHNEENVKLILKAIELSPESQVYPHPLISGIFSGITDDLYAGTENVASWAGRENMGLKPRRDMQQGEIIGIYGGNRTKTLGNYVLDLTQTGGEKLMVDAEGYLESTGVLGRINEDIHTNRCNTEIHVEGITYTTKLVREGNEFLTTYGDGYRWDHVVQIGLNRLRRDLSEDFPGTGLDIPERLKDLKRSNPLHAWVEKLVCIEGEGNCYHSTRDVIFLIISTELSASSRRT